MRLAILPSFIAGFSMPMLGLHWHKGKRAMLSP
jgi:hypothetical protein